MVDVLTGVIGIIGKPKILFLAGKVRFEESEGRLPISAILIVLEIGVAGSTVFDDLPDLGVGWLVEGFGVGIPVSFIQKGQQAFNFVGRPLGVSEPEYATGDLLAGDRGDGTGDFRCCRLLRPNAWKALPAP